MQIPEYRTQNKSFPALNFVCPIVKMDKMTEQDKRDDTYKSKRKPDILRAKDIIPVRSRPAGENENVNQVDIPRFDLANDIMAQQRRHTAFHRKGPSSVFRSPSSDFGQPFSAQSYTSRWDPIIADIVARDIERLCGHG